MKAFVQSMPELRALKVVRVRCAKRAIEDSVEVEKGQRISLRCPLCRGHMKCDCPENCPCRQLTARFARHMTLGANHAT